MAKIEGLIAAAFTPFHEDGSLNLDQVQPLTDRLYNEGVKGIFVCGSNGEGPNLTTEERFRVAEAFVKAGNKRLLIIVHVGHNCIAESKLLAKHAAEIGADAISSVASFYFKPRSVEVLVHCMREIASAAPDIPFYYYHIPHLTGLGMDMVEFLDLAGPLIPNLAGIKYTAPTLHEYHACLQYGQGKYDILFGLDELLLPALAMGARGAIGSTYTFAAPLYLEILGAFRAGNLELASEKQVVVSNFIRVLLRYPPIPAQKSIMKMLGWNFGSVRLPLYPISASEYNTFQQELEKARFFEFVQPGMVTSGSD